MGGVSQSLLGLGVNAVRSGEKGRVGPKGQDTPGAGWGSWGGAVSPFPTSYGVWGGL